MGKTLDVQSTETIILTKISLKIMAFTYTVVDRISTILCHSKLLKSKFYLELR